MLSITPKCATLMSVSEPLPVEVQAAYKLEVQRLLGALHSATTDEEREAIAAGIADLEDMLGRVRKSEPGQALE